MERTHVYGQLKKRSFYVPRNNYFQPSLQMSIDTNSMIKWDEIKPIVLFCIENDFTFKHCQRHNGPRVLTLKLELSLQLNRMPFALVTNMTTRWRNFHSCKIVHQMAPLAVVVNLATRWPHLHKLQIWAPDGATCISSKFGHQMALL